MTLVMKRPSNNTLKLTPRVHPVVKDFIAQDDLLEELTRVIGSPLNILFPDIIVENKQHFENVLAKHSIRGRVYFAHKANRSRALLKRLSTSPSAYVDVASEV